MPVVETDMMPASPSGLMDLVPQLSVLLGNFSLPTVLLKFMLSPQGRSTSSDRLIQSKMPYLLDVMEDNSEGPFQL